MFDGLVRWMMTQASRVMTALDSRVPEVPGELSGVCSSISTAVQQVQSVSWFVPLGVVGVAFGIVLAGVVAGFTIKIVRIIASFATLGGGAA